MLGPPIILWISGQTRHYSDFMTDEVNRTCPHCGGKNTSYFIGVEETVWFTTKYETVDGFGLFACSDINRHKCPNLQRPELAIAMRDNNADGDA